MSQKRVLVLGNTGMVGSAIARKLNASGAYSVIEASTAQIDLRNQVGVKEFLAETQPETIILAAALVGGIKANSENQYDFLTQNLLIETNVISTAHMNNIQNLIFLGSSCIYPRDAEQPIREEYLLSGPLEKTNEGYALAKIAGLKMMEYLKRDFGRNYLSLMPCNLYGVGDNFDLEKSHVIPALINRIHQAKKEDLGEVTLWGSGSALREFLYVDDLAAFVELSLNSIFAESLINVGSGKEVTIYDLANLIADVIEYEGKFLWDKAMPDGTPRKLLNSDVALSKGWIPSTSLREGLDITYKWFLNSVGKSEKTPRTPLNIK